MKTNVYFPSKDQTHTKVLNAFAKGIPGECNICSLDDRIEIDADIAVVFGVEKPSVPYSARRGEVITRYKAAGKKVIILERGYIKRNEYWSAGFDSFNGRADFRNQKSKPDRWRKLGVTLEPDTGGDGEYILLIGQVPWDASVQDSDHITWLGFTAKALKAMGYTVLFREHPLGPGINLQSAIKSKWTLEEDLSAAIAVVTFNSNVGVDAAIAGIPVFSFDKGSMVYPISFHNLSDLNLIGKKSFSRDEWANNIAYAQWTLDEFEKGLAWKHLMGVR